MTKKKETSNAAADTQPAAQSASEKRRPIHQIRIEDVSASVWKRELQSKGQLLTFYSVTPERSYKDRDGQYRYTKTFDQDSLGNLVAVIQKASEYIHGLQHPEPAQE